MCVEYFGCCFDYFLQLLDSDWYLSDNGHDDGNCGKSYSSACETLHWLLGLFYNTSYKSSLKLRVVADTSLIINKDLMVSH